MIIDGEKIEIGNIIITDSLCTINGKKIKTNNIRITSKNNKYAFVFWTIVPYNYFNALKLNEKTSIMDKIDDGDIDLEVDGTIYINFEENSHVYFTKLKENVFRLNADITHPEEELILEDPQNIVIDKFEIEAIIDFNQRKEK